MNGIISGINAVCLTSGTRHECGYGYATVTEGGGGGAKEQTNYLEFERDYFCCVTTFSKVRAKAVVRATRVLLDPDDLANPYAF